MAILNTVEATIVANFQDQLSGPSQRAFQQFKLSAEAALASFLSRNLAQSIQSQFSQLVQTIQASIPELSNSLASLSTLGAEVTLTVNDQASPVLFAAIDTLAFIEQQEIIAQLSVNDRATPQALSIRAGLEQIFGRTIFQVVETIQRTSSGNTFSQSSFQSSISSLSSLNTGLLSPVASSTVPGKQTLSQVERQPRPSRDRLQGKGDNITLQITGGFLPDKATARKFVRIMEDERRRIKERKSR